MDDRDAKNIVILRKMFPDGVFGDVCFVKFVFRVGFFGFNKQLFANIDTGVFDVFG